MVPHEIYTLSLHDALPIFRASDEHVGSFAGHEDEIGDGRRIDGAAGAGAHNGANLRNDAARKRVAQKNIRVTSKRDRKSTRLNSSHTVISYAVFCLKKKNK